MSRELDAPGRDARDEPVARKLAEPAILAFDIDGTVLDADDRPVPGIARVLRELAAAGVLLVPCTGRPLHGALRAAGALDVSPAACVAYHGALVVDLQSGERLRHLTMPDGLAARTALAGLAAGLEVSLYVDDERLDLPPGWSPGERVLPGRVSGGPPPCDDAPDARAPGRAPAARAADATASADPTESRAGPARIPPARPHPASSGVAGVTRLVVAGDPGRVTPVLPELGEARRAGMRIDQVRPGVVVVLPGAADKGEGLRLVAAHFGVPLRRAVAAGDDLDDITLLLTAGRAVAVGDAGPALRAVAGATVTQGDLATALRGLFTRLG